MTGKQPRIFTLTVPVASAIVDCNLFTVEQGAEYEVVEVTETHTVAGSDGGAVTADLTKCGSGVAPSAGTSVLASTFNLKSTANTPVIKTAGNGGLAAALGTRTLTAGQTLALNVTGTLTALAGLALTIVLKQRRAPINR